MKKLSAKERIVDIASNLFYFQGYNQTGINQIINEAGVAKASMYQHFRSKEDVAVEYLRGRHITWMGKLEESINRQNYNEKKVLGCFDYLEEWLTEVNFRGCGWQNIIADLPVDQTKIYDQAVLHKNEFRTFIQNLLKKDDTHTIEQAEQIGDEILILIEGAIILSQIQKDDWPIKSAKNACVKLLS